MSITALAKQKFGKPLAASALALSMAFSPMASNDAQAADRSASVASTNNVSLSTQRKDSVKIKDVSNETRQYAELLAAGASGKFQKMVILYGGNNPELIQRVQEGASVVKNAGGAILGIVIAQYDPDIEIKNRDSFIAFVDGARVISPRNPTKFDAQKVALLLADILDKTMPTDSPSLAMN